MKKLLLITTLLAGAQLSLAAEKISIMLDWFVNPDHAAIIVAEQKGYFKKHGLDVE
ncbi:MAG: thiamine biosynthesis protein, partial [Gammaproteobacteria bacterium]